LAAELARDYVQPDFGSGLPTVNCQQREAVVRPMRGYKTYVDREEARRDVFDYIEMFYNPKRRHGHANDVSPVEFENQYFNRLQGV
jgi:transposase InsO family protein